MLVLAVLTFGRGFSQLQPGLCSGSMIWEHIFFQTILFIPKCFKCLSMIRSDDTFVFSIKLFKKCFDFDLTQPTVFGTGYHETTLLKRLNGLTYISGRTSESCL